MGLISASIVPGANLTMQYGERLLNGIAAADAARLPKGINTNHPAFVYGHLAIYPENMLELLGRTDLMKKDAQWTQLESLCAAGKDCLDDPSGSTYPAFETIVSRWRDRMNLVIKTAAETGDDVLSREMPDPKRRERFPTIGSLTAFLLLSHPQMHFGQISAWRRIMGMPAAM